MIEKIITAVEPFMLTLIIVAGASMAGYITFTNAKAVGIATMFCGILLVLKHVVTRVTTK